MAALDSYSVPSPPISFSSWREDGSRLWIIDFGTTRGRGPPRAALRGAERAKSNSEPNRRITVSGPNRSHEKPVPNRRSRRSATCHPPFCGGEDSAKALSTGSAPAFQSAAF